jgi:hypothetical protein
VIGRPSRIALFTLTATLAVMHPAPAAADLLDPDDPILPLPKLQLPDVRDLPIVRDVPIVQQLPDVRELPVVRDVTDPIATPAPVAPTPPSSPAPPAATPAPSGEPGGSTSGGGSTSAGSATTGGGSTSGGGSSSGGGSTSGGGPAPAGNATTGGGSTPASTSAPRGVTRSGARPSADAPSIGSRRATTRLSTRTPTAGSPAPVERRERRLRRTVRRLSGCLDALATGSRRVLVLRAGLGAHGPLSRRAVAERLDATVPQVARDERRGLRDLRGAARAGSCGAAMQLAATSSAGSAASPGGGSDTPAAVAAREADGSARGDALPSGRSAVQEEEFRSGPAPATIVARVADGPPVLLALVLAFLAGFGTVAIYQFGNSRSGAAAVRLRRRDGARHR